MPMYEFLCRDCGHSFETLRRINDDRKLECPKCHSENVAQLFSAFSSGGCGGGSPFR